MPCMRPFHRTAFLAALAASAPLHGQVLPLQRWDVAQGLPATRITAIEPDPRGWMWVGTWEGLALLQGPHARAFGVAEGLPHSFVNDVASSADGVLWVATKGGGLARLRSDPVTPLESAFEPVHPSDAAPVNDASCIAIDGEGVVWCGTDSGIWAVRAAPSPPGLASARCVWPDLFFEHAGQACTDRDGSVWLLARGSLHAARAGGQEVFAAPTEDGNSVVVTAEADGTLLAGFDRGVWRCDPRADESQRWRRLPVALPAGALVRALVRDTIGDLWIGTNRGLVRVDGRAQVIYGLRNGLPDEIVRALAIGADGLPWIGTWSAGVCRLATRALVSWTPSCGLPDANALQIVLGADDGVLVGLERGLAWIDGEDGVRRLTESDALPFRAAGQRIARDAQGGWWIGTDEGLWNARGAVPDMATAVRVSDARCAPRSSIFGTPCGAERGALWYSEGSGRIVRLQLGPGGEIHDCLELDLGARAALPPRVILPRANGDAWLLPYDGLLRVRGGRVEDVAMEAGILTHARCAYADRAGRLWIGTRFRGLWRCDEPDVDAPRLERVPVRLPSEAVWSIAEDAAGRLYLGTARGLVRVDLSTLETERIGVAAGLAGEIVTAVLADSRGRIWCSTSGGVSRLDPQAELRDPAPPQTWIVAVRAAGDDVAIALRGAGTVDAGEVPADAASLEVECSAAVFTGADAVLFQERFDTGAWSAPGPERRLELARLAPGDYHLEVRAVLGRLFGEPASVRVRVLPPWWRTGWFAALVVAAVASLVAVAWTTRQARRRALESVRRRIADDVHDEVGAGLAQIAILAESARAGAGPESDERLREAARIARALRGSVAEIVRALDPRPEDLETLALRARSVAANLFESQGTEVQVRSTGLAGRFGLDPARRRHVLLAITELLANAARHSGAELVEVEIAARDGELRVVVSDDGRGFAADAHHAGHGIEGLRRRAREVGGSLRLESSPGQGTRAELRVPLPAG